MHRIANADLVDYMIGQSLQFRRRQTVVSDVSHDILRIRHNLGTTLDGALDNPACKLSLGHVPGELVAKSADLEGGI